MPFVAVGRLFAAMPVPVPRVLEASDDLGVLLLDDLGDETLFAHLPSATADERAALYRQAIDLIATIQERGAALAVMQQSPARHFEALFSLGTLHVLFRVACAEDEHVHGRNRRTVAPPDLAHADPVEPVGRADELLPASPK